MDHCVTGDLSKFGDHILEDMVQFCLAEMWWPLTQSTDSVMCTGICTNLRINIFNLHKFESQMFREAWPVRKNVYSMFYLLFDLFFININIIP